MASKSLFQSLFGALIPATDARNSEAAPAYAYPPKHKLAQLAATGCLNGTFYADDRDQLDTVLALCKEIEPEFIAKTAIYSREEGAMKDMPALLCAALSVVAPRLLERIFTRVIDNAKMLRNFVQIIRSGVVGRKSLGSLPKRLVRDWLASRSDEELFRSSSGNDPSLADIIKMVHPRPAGASREALYGYLTGRGAAEDALPPLVRAYEAFKKDLEGEVPDVPFQLLTSLQLQKRHWASIAARAPWQMTRMNLNTFVRHGVFAEAPQLAGVVADRLRDPEAIARARAFPYQLLAAYVTADGGVPAVIRESLQDAMEHAIENVPAVAGKVYVCCDVSGSMRSPVTGRRKGATTAVRCVDVAALTAAAFVRKNPGAEVLPFEAQVVDLQLNPRDSVMTNATKLSAVCGGGTNCSAPLARLNTQRAQGDLVVFVSDNESWVDARGGRGTATLHEWARFKDRCPSARLVCIDVQPNGTTQAVERSDILNVGGFSDAVFQVVAKFADGKLDPAHWVGVIETLTL
ncbi:MAG TPA: RNA-binding protein [Planctomycetes bacterium]|nr:RNA-binding protein [Planctomycetota bacterium]